MKIINPHSIIKKEVALFKPTLYLLTISIEAVSYKERSTVIQCTLLLW